VLEDEMTFLLGETTVAAGAGTFVLVTPGRVIGSLRRAAIGDVVFVARDWAA
jgi:hypothetical protein